MGKYPLAAALGARLAAGERVTLAEISEVIHREPLSEEDWQRWVGHLLEPPPLDSITGGIIVKAGEVFPSGPIRRGR